MVVVFVKANDKDCQVSTSIRVSIQLCVVDVRVCIREADPKAKGLEVCRRGSGSSRSCLSLSVYYHTIENSKIENSKIEARRGEAALTRGGGCFCLLEAVCLFHCAHEV
jgi:hypothetical protein